MSGWESMARGKGQMMMTPQNGQCVTMELEESLSEELSKDMMLARGKDSCLAKESTAHQMFTLLRITHKSSNGKVTLTKLWYRTELTWLTPRRLNLPLKLGAIIVEPTTSQRIQRTLDLMEYLLKKLNLSMWIEFLKIIFLPFSC